MKHEFAGLTALVDLDDCVAEWTAGFYETFAADYPNARILPHHLRNTFSMFRPEDEEIHDIIAKTMDKPGLYRNLRPTPGAVEAVREMVEAGINVVFVTSPWNTNPTCASDKLAWIDEVFGEGWSDRAIITKDKTRVRGDFLFDDKGHITGQVKPTWIQVLVNQPQNQHPSDLTRLYNWSEWQTILKDLQKFNWRRPLFSLRRKYHQARSRFRAAFPKHTR